MWAEETENGFERPFDRSAWGVTGSDDYELLAICFHTKRDDI